MYLVSSNVVQDVRGLRAQTAALISCPWKHLLEMWLDTLCSSK